MAKIIMIILQTGTSKLINNKQMILDFWTIYLHMKDIL
jgi:hypothetical protein